MSRSRLEFAGRVTLLGACVLTAQAIAQPQLHPRDGEIHDADTRAWWHTTEALSGDSMEGRDTGSAAYLRAAEYVAARFKAAGLQPAGENGSYFQPVLMHEIEVTPKGTSFTLIRPDGSETTLAFLQQITVRPAENLPARMEAALTFRGYCGRESMADIAGRIVVCFGTDREGLPGGAERAANAREGKALGLINIDDPYFTIEPPRWPTAYARTVKLRAPPEAVSGSPYALVTMRVSAETADALFADTGQDPAAILKLGGAKQPLASFDIPAKLRVRLSFTQRDISSPNVLATLSGDDPKLGSEYVVAAAHLDGYGFGTPVNGDGLYNGTLDDAAYVALLIQMADDIKVHRLPAPKRNILFAAFTGEEKGLLGSYWFVAHPTVPVEQLAADVNLDQLRPLFPLHILTAEALADTTLGDTARAVAAPLHIEIRADVEPERNLLHRADQYPFLTIHVPAISFIFGYDPNTDAESRYREWYQHRYHRPQDDLTQPVDFKAAAQFDRFFYELVEAIANAPTRPLIYPTSPFAAKHAAATAGETAAPLPFSQLLTAAQVAVDTCKAHGYAVTVTVVDADLSTRLVLRGEGAPSQTVDISRRKAYTVVKTGMSSGEFGKSAAKPAPAAPNPGASTSASPPLPGAVEGDPNLITWAGGLPIRVQGALVGAMSASGAPGGEKDEACVIAGIAKIAGAAAP